MAWPMLIFNHYFVFPVGCPPLKYQLWITEHYSCLGSSVSPGFKLTEPVLFLHPTAKNI